MPAQHAPDDIWSLDLAEMNKPTLPATEVETIEKIVALDRQFGVTAPKSVPDALRECLFGPTEDASASPMFLYAILDASMVPNLASMLDTSELAHAPLVLGDSFKELEEVAPWIVRLEDGNAFTRRLFTQNPDSPWSFWDKDAALFVRSRSPLEDVARHFRKLMRVEDENGNWFYFRFWSNCAVANYLQDTQESAADVTLPFFASRRTHIIDALICTQAPETAYVCRLSEDATAKATECAGRIDTDILKLLALKAHTRNFVGDFHRSGKTSPAPEQIEQDVHIATHVVRHFVSLGFKSKYHLGSFVYWALSTGARFDALSEILQSASQATAHDPNARFVAMAREMKRIYAGDVRNHHGG